MFEWTDLEHPYEDHPDMPLKEDFEEKDETWDTGCTYDDDKDGRKYGST